MSLLKKRGKKGAVVSSSISRETQSRHSSPAPVKQLNKRTLKGKNRQNVQAFVKQEKYSREESSNELEEAMEYYPISAPQTIVKGGKLAQQQISRKRGHGHYGMNHASENANHLSGNSKMTQSSSPSKLMEEMEGGPVPPLLQNNSSIMGEGFNYFMPHNNNNNNNDMGGNNFQYNDYANHYQQIQQVSQHVNQLNILNPFSPTHIITGTNFASPRLNQNSSMQYGANNDFYALNTPGTSRPNIKRQF